MVEDTKQLKKKTISGFFWTFGQNMSVKAMGFIVSLVLARLLSPSDFGTVAMTYIFMNIAGVFASSGLGTSLIQKKDVDELDYDTVFWAGLGISSIIYIILFIAAHFIAILYHSPIIEPIIRALGISLFFSSINSVQSAEVSRALDFKKYFKVSIISTVVSSVVGLTMAFLGYGVWALVVSSVISGIASTVALNIIIKWHPKLQFSWTRLKALYSFGLNLMFADVIGTIFNELKGLLIGVKYKASDLGFYNRGDSLPGFVYNSLSSSLNSILLPAMSKVQDDPEQVKAAIRRSMMTSTYFVAPCVFGLAATANHLIPVLYSSKWLPAVPYMQVLAFGYLFSILSITNLEALKAVGRTDITLKLEFYKKPIWALIIFFTIQISPLALAIGNTCYGIVSTAVNSWPNKKIINYSIWDQVKDVLPPIILSSFMGSIVLIIGMLDINIYLLLLMQLGTGALLYIGLSYYLKIEAFTYVVKSFKEYTRR